jgi:uncharacterized protein YdhG (YjbR/CyaY superfamily)
MGGNAPHAATDRMDTQPAAAASIDDYIAAQPGEVQPILQRIRAIVSEEAPNARECISYRMPAFTQGGVLLYFAAFKRHIGVYPPVRGDAALLDALAPYRGEKGNLSFPLSKQMPDDLIRRVARQRVKENAARAAENTARAARARTK